MEWQDRSVLTDKRALLELVDRRVGRPDPEDLWGPEDQAVLPAQMDQPVPVDQEDQTVPGDRTVQAVLTDQVVRVDKAVLTVRADHLAQMG
jgi:hypothetical protein